MMANGCQRNGASHSNEPLKAKSRDTSYVLICTHSKKQTHKLPNNGDNVIRESFCDSENRTPQPDDKSGDRQDVLTPRQRRLANYVISYYAAHGHQPLLKEIQADLGHKSHGVIHRELAKCVEKGVLTWKGRSLRTLRPALPICNECAPLLSECSSVVSLDVVRELFDQGHDTFQIAARVKNTTEAQVYNALARLREDAHAKGLRLFRTRKTEDHHVQISQ